MDKRNNRNQTFHSYSCLYLCFERILDVGHVKLVSLALVKQIIRLGILTEVEDMRVSKFTV